MWKRGIVCQTWQTRIFVRATQHPKLSGPWRGVRVQGSGSICLFWPLAFIGDLEILQYSIDSIAWSSFDFLKTGIETYFYSASSIFKLYTIYTGIEKRVPGRGWWSDGVIDGLEWWQKCKLKPYLPWLPTFWTQKLDRLVISDHRKCHRHNMTQPYHWP